MVHDAWPRAIVHVDMDAFFASVEIRENRELAGRPIAVGGVGPRGVIATASYEARAFGVRSAMATARALALCPQLVVLPGRHAYYKEVSDAIMAVLDSFSPIREAVSLDEAYLDVTGAQRLFGSPREVAFAIRQAVWDNVRLTCSVGAGVSKSVAKIASGFEKPHGITVVEPSETAAFLAPLPISAIGGVGPVAQKKFAQFGISKVGELAELPLATVRRVVGSGAPALLALAQGHDSRPVGAAPKDRSVGKERTFDVDIADHGRLRAIALSMADSVAHRLRSHGLAARSVAVKMRAPDSRTVTRTLSFDTPCAESDRFAKRALQAFERAYLEVPRVRLLGVRAEHVVPAQGLAIQADLAGKSDAWADVDRAADAAREKFGAAALMRAAGLEAQGVRAQDGTDNER